MWRIIIALLLVVGTFLPLETYAQGNRRETGPGGTRPFAEGEFVQGTFILYPDGWYAIGPCNVTRAPVFGTVENGVINPYPQERARFSECEFQPPEEATPTAGQPAAVTILAPSDPAPIPQGPPAPQRRITGEGFWGYFAPNEQVQGYTIRRRSDNAMWRLCRFDTIPFDGWVLSGVVYPYVDEVAQMGVCDSNNPVGMMAAAQPPITTITAPPVPQAPYYAQPIPYGPPQTFYGTSQSFYQQAQPPGLCAPATFRQQTGEGGQIRFGPNECVVGGNIRLDNGREFGPCYIEYSPIGGVVTSGARYPSREEALRFPRCPI